MDVLAAPAHPGTSSMAARRLLREEVLASFRQSGEAVGRGIGLGTPRKALEAISRRGRHNLLPGRLEGP
jgi:hypothetical protein